jgi:plastocyanin
MTRLLIAVILSAAFFPIEVGAQTGGLTGRVLINSEPADRAVVFLQTPDGRLLSSPPTEKTIRQENLRFKPDFLVVPAGTTIRFENHDDEIHNIYSKSGADRFDTGAHLPGTTKKVTLKEPGAVPLRCRTHQNMRGLIFVSPSPYFAVTDDRGQFEILNVPYGSYRIEAWHPRLTAEESARGGQVLEVGAGPTVLKLRFNAKAAKGVDLTETADLDWVSVVEQIHAELERAITSWKNGNRTAATSTVMSAQSKLYGESGLRDKIAQSIGPDRALEYERGFDGIRKGVQGVGGTEPVTEAALRQEASLLIEGLTADVKKMTAP